MLRHYRQSCKIPAGLIPTQKRISTLPNMFVPGNIPSSLKKRLMKFWRKKMPFRPYYNTGHWSRYAHIAQLDRASAPAVEGYRFESVWGLRLQVWFYLNMS